MPRNQMLLIACAIALGIILFFLPHKPSEKETVSAENLEAIVLAQKNALSEAEQKMLGQLEAGGNYDSLANFSRRKLKNPVLAAFYQNKIAEKNSNAANWKKAGEDFYKAVQVATDTAKAKLMQSAIASFANAIKMDSTDLNLKTKLAVCYVEAGTDPMKGITLLRDVVSKDSSNIEAQLQLGFFSITSGQFPKAVERFNKVLQIDSTYISAYVYLGDTYVRMGDKPRAIGYYEKYKARVKDTIVQRDVEAYINQLKTNSN